MMILNWKTFWSPWFIQTYFIAVKVKVQVNSLISSLKTYLPTSHWLMDLFIRVPFQLHGGHTLLFQIERGEQLYFYKNPAPIGVRNRTAGSHVGRAPLSLTIAPCPSPCKS